jgi:hypothetical protein
MKYIKRFSHFGDSLTESNDAGNDFMEFINDLNLKLIPIRQDFNLDVEVYFDYNIVSDDEGIINTSTDGDKYYNLDQYKDHSDNLELINIDITKDKGYSHIPKVEELNDEIKAIINYFYNNDFTEGFSCKVYTKSNDRFGIQSRDIFENPDSLDLFKPDPYSEYDEVDIIGIIIKKV